MGVSDLQKTLGLDLRKLSTEFGLTFRRKESPEVDVSLFCPTKWGRIGTEAWTKDGNTTVTGFLVINFGGKKK